MQTPNIKPTNPYKYAAKAVKKWADLLGFSHYTLVVGQLPPDESNEDWANCIWSIEEEWAVIRFGDISNFDKLQLDHLVIHELTHILIALAVAAPAFEEVVCNRIATAITGPTVGARGLQVHGILSANPSETLDTACTTPSIASAEKRFSVDETALIKDSMPLVILRLPRAPRELLCRIFFDGESLSDIGKDLGINRSTVMRRRDNALRLMRSHYEVTDGR